MIRLADYVVKTLVEHGIDHSFLITGGMAMHLNDAFGRARGLSYTCCHHEQACAIAAEGYARVTGKPAVVSVTGGPGGINALNGVFGAYTDSIPMLIISGQAKRETCLVTHRLTDLRQLGDQEVDIVRMVGGITKYAFMVTDPLTIRHHLEKAIYLATHGRPGPCWIDIPIDVQSTQIDETQLAPYDPAPDLIKKDAAELRTEITEVIRRLKSAQRPVIMAGTGVRLAGALELFEQVIARLGIPVTTAWTAHDTIPSDHPLHCGRPSTVGDRAGNFTVQNADVLLVLGSRLPIRQISYNWENFAPYADIIQVDVDPAELAKPTVKPSLPIACDLKVFLEALNQEITTSGFDATQHAAWLAWCRERVKRYSPVTEAQRQQANGINPYHFIDRLIRRLSPTDIIVSGDATAAIVPFQVGWLQKGMRLFSSAGDASMGYDIPAAIGASVGAGKDQRVICFAGDGSGHFNIQELETIRYHQFPIKIFILNNDGYLSMRLSQSSFFTGNMIGEGPKSGVTFPDYTKLARAYGLPAVRLETTDFSDDLDAFLAKEGPALCEVILDPDQSFEPKLSSRRLDDGRMVTASLEDMAPFLSREELAENMLPPVSPRRCPATH